MIIQHSLTSILSDHVLLELESIDRMYLNVYRPKLQTEACVASFFKKHRGALIASSALMGPMSNAFRYAIDKFTERNRIPVIAFARKQRKDDVAREYLASSASTATNISSANSIRRVSAMRRSTTASFRARTRLATTPGRFRTRVITNGVTPSLHADYKNTRIKQYHKEGQALRTETTVNDTRDFNIGRSLLNLPALRKIGFSANRHLLDVQRLTHDCFVGHEALQKAQAPRVEANQRTSGLRFGDPKTHILLQALLIFQLQVYGFSNRDLRQQLAALLHIDMAGLTPGQMTYLLRKARLHGLIARVPKSHRYRLTEPGLRLRLFFTRSYNRLLEPAAARILKPAGEVAGKSRNAIDRPEDAMDACCRAFHLAA